MHPLAFANLKLPPAQLQNLEALGYAAMTPIQAEALPIALAGRDLIAQAKTGSGKTAAFLIPLLERLDLKSTATQALIVCPTRELCIQVTQELRQLARYRGNVTALPLYGGQDMRLQKESLRNGAHILIGTPGRILDHHRRETLDLQAVGTLVLDEADRMLDMGFLGDITEIIATLPKKRQSLMFSATFPEDIQVLSRRFQDNPAHVHIQDEAGASDIDQKFLICAKESKLDGLAALLCQSAPPSALIFCNTKVAVKEVHHHLSQLGFGTEALHGELEQRDREHILMRFRHASLRVLVATDVAARGLDIEDLGAVVNFEVPHDMETYVHRIGRTGRAGKGGWAVTLALPTETHKIEAAREYLKIDVPAEPMEWSTHDAGRVLTAEQTTLCIAGGRKDKLRAGDILGALTGEKGLDGKLVGKIDVMDYETFVSVQNKAAHKAYARLSENKIKGKKYRVRILE